MSSLPGIAISVLLNARVVLFSLSFITTSAWFTVSSALMYLEVSLDISEICCFLSFSALPLILNEYSTYIQ